MYHYWYSSAYACILVKGLIILIAIPEQVSLHMSQVGTSGQRLSPVSEA